MFSKSYEEKLKSTATRDFMKWQARKLAQINDQIGSINKKIVALENHPEKSKHDTMRIMANESEIASLNVELGDLQV
jgi:hypothetical protein